MITPKDKAKELLYKFAYGEEKDLQVDLNYAKLCSLICINEILKVVAFHDHKVKLEFENTCDLSDDMFESYWEEVKEEINKL